MKPLDVLAQTVCLSTETPVQRHGRLAVVGNRLVNKDGNPVQLRGMSFFWSMAGEGIGYYNANVVNWLVDDWKVNVIRAAMGIKEAWGYGYLTSYGKAINRQLIIDVVDAAIAKGIYVIIDWHTETAYDDTDAAKVFFEEMATKYKGIPNVLYEIFNEPKHKGADFWAKYVKPYTQTIVNAIWTIDPQNVIIVGTPHFCREIDVATADPIMGDNLVYSLHFYSASHKKDSLEMKVLEAMNTNNKAIFVSEFGICNEKANPPIDINETNVWLNFLDTNKVSCMVV